MRQLFEPDSRLSFVKRTAVATDEVEAGIAKQRTYRGEPESPRPRQWDDRESAFVLRPS
jgi:hypothetical protein